jgi:hypothetical protein
MRDVIRTSVGDALRPQDMIFIAPNEAARIIEPFVMLHVMSRSLAPKVAIAWF